MNISEIIENPGAGELRKFGLVTGAIVAILFGVTLPWLFDYPWPVWPWILTGILWAWGLLLPSTLFIVYKAWLKFGHVVGWINTRIILSVMFYLIFFPVGMLMRIFGNDPMSRRFDSSAESYRILSKQEDKDNVERPY